MNDFAEQLKERAVIPLNAAAATLGLTAPTLRKRMAESGIPEINLGPRKRGVLLAHIDELIASRARPALKESWKESAWKEIA